MCWQAFFQQPGTFNLNCFQFVLTPWAGVPAAAAKNSVFCFPFQFPVCIVPGAAAAAPVVESEHIQVGLELFWPSEQALRRLASGCLLEE